MEKEIEELENKENIGSKENRDNKELVKTILASLKKSDDETFSQEELATIEDIVFTQVLANGKYTGISLEDAFLFENLKTITLKNYNLSSRDLKVICEHPKLQEISFLGCTFEEASFDEISKHPEILKFIFCSKLPKKFPAVDKVLVAFSNLDFNSIDFSKATIIKVKNSEISNARDLDEFSNLVEVNLDGSTLTKDNGEKVEDITVGKACIYSHELEDRNFVDDGTKDPARKYDEEIEK